MADSFLANIGQDYFISNGALSPWSGCDA